MPSSSWNDRWTRLSPITKVGWKLLKVSSILNDARLDLRNELEAWVLFRNEIPRGLLGEDLGGAVLHACSRPSVSLTFTTRARSSDPTCPGKPPGNFPVMSTLRRSPLFATRCQSTGLANTLIHYNPLGSPVASESLPWVLAPGSKKPRQQT